MGTRRPVVLAASTPMKAALPAVAFLAGVALAGKWLVTLTYDGIMWRECVSFRLGGGWAVTFGREW